MGSNNLINKGKRIAKEITTQHTITVKIRNRLFIKGNIEDYERYRTIIAELKKAEKHEKELEKQWWFNQEKIRKARKNI